MHLGGNETLTETVVDGIGDSAPLPLDSRKYLSQTLLLVLERAPLGRHQVGDLLAQGGHFHEML